MRRKKFIIGLTATIAVLSTIGMFASEAYAYSAYSGMSNYGNIYKNASGTFSLSGGDELRVESSGPFPQLKAGVSNLYAADEQTSISGSGQGNLDLIQTDLIGQDASNGFLLIAAQNQGQKGTSTNIADMANWMGGNSQYVESQLAQPSQIMTTQDQENFTTTYWVSYANLVSFSGAKFGTKTETPTGGTTSQGDPIYLFGYPVLPSDPPSTTSLSVTDANTNSSTITPGDPISINASSSIPLWSGLAMYHYDAVQFTNTSTGKSTWATLSGDGASINVTDNGQTTINGMVPKLGGTGPQSDSFTDNADSSLATGSYTATFWVADGVHRLCPTPATANFTIGAGSGPSVSLTANPIQLPTGQTSTLTANATGMTSQYDIKIVDQSGDNTLGGQNSYQDGITNESSLSTSAKDNTAQSVTYVAEIVNASTGQVASTSSPVTVTWGSGSVSGNGPAITLTANPTSNQTGDKSTISYSTTGWSYGDYVTVSGVGGTDMWSNSNDGNSKDSYSEVENPQNGATTTVKYTAILYNSQGVAQNASSVTVTWSSTAIPTTTSLALSAKPTTLQVGAPTTLTVVVPPNPTGGAAPPMEFIQIINQATGQAVGAGMYTGSGNVTYGEDSAGETETITNTYSSNVEGTQTFVAQLWGPGVTPWNHSPILTSNSVTVTWVKPTVTLSANPTSAVAGQASQISYSTIGFAAGDTVAISGTGGTDMWSETADTKDSDSYSETENPQNGATVTVRYTATLKDTTGTILSTSNITVTWTAPTISMGANPQRMVPGQPSTIHYSVQNLAPDDYVTVVSTGGADGWNAANQTKASETYQEVENPTAGQTITVNYTATVYNSLGQALAQASTSAEWVNAWTGTISLSGNPMFLPTGSDTNLTASTTQAVPSGYTLYIKDTSTGQIISNSGTAPEQAQYTSYQAETDQFVAYLNDGYENVGNNSNAVNVTWSRLALNANPLQLPVNQSTTLTASGQNIPSGDYLIIENQSTGQVVGYSQSSPYSVNVSESTAQNDTFVAYINSSPTTSGAYMTSNPVAVDWYSVTLIANPTSLPVGNTSTLTAMALSLPSGYVLDIVDETTNTIVASGQPGQTVVQSLQTGNKVETDKYIAQVVQPGDPPIPGLSYSGGSAGNVYEVNFGGNDVLDVDASTGTVVATIPVGSDPSGIVYTGSLLYVTNQLSNSVSVINPTTNTVVSTIYGFNYPYAITYANGYVYVGNWAGSIYTSSVSVINASTNQFVTGVGTNGLGNMGVTYHNGYIYAVNALSNNVGVINASNNQLVYTYPLPANTFTWSTANGMTTVSGPGSVMVPYPLGDNVSASSYSTGTASVGTPGTSQFPFWTFQNVPSYVPTSLFPDAVQPSSNGGDEIWVNGSSSQQNGTAFFQSSFTLPQAEQVTFQTQGVDDYEQVYVDGVPIMQQGDSGGVGGSIPNTSSTTVSLSAGQHQVIIEGMNNNEFTSPNNSAAGVSLVAVVNGSQVVLNTGNTSQWTTTGYVTQLPAGWFSGAIGVYNWTEYIIQENQNQPIYEEQPYSITNSAQNVAMQSNVVSVSWINPITPPDNPTLTALPTNVVKPAPTQFLVNFDASDASFVNQELGGTAPVQIYNAFTWRPVATGTWSPNNGLSLTIPYNPVPGGSSQYLAFLEDSNHHPLAVSNQVTVTDTGNGKLGNSYSELVCGPNGDGTEIFQNYQNGKLVSSRTVPLTLTNLNVNGIFNPTQQLKNEYPGMTIKLPVTNAELSYGPTPLRVQAPFGFAVQFPDAQPTKVTATFTVNEGYSVDVAGDTSWTVSMKPAQNQPLYWQGATIMPKLPDGVHIMVKIVAEDNCGTNTLVNNDFVTTAGRPQWYFVQPTKLGN